VLNESTKGRWYFSREVQAESIASALSILGVLALGARFMQVQSSPGPADRWITLHVSPALSISLIAVSLGFLYGRLSQSAGVETDLSLAQAYRLLNDIAKRQVQSGSPFHLNLIAALTSKTEAIRQTATFILDNIWRIGFELGTEELRQQLGAAIGARHLRVRLVEDEHQPIVNHETIMEFQIVPIADAAVGESSLLEGEGLESQLLIHIVSNNVKVKDGPLRISLHNTGPGSIARATIVPLEEGRCELTFLLIAAETLDLLQSYTTKIQVLSAPEGE